MQNENKKNPTENEKVENQYELKTEAVDRLVNANKKTYPKTEKDPGKKYRSKGLIDRIPEPIKALFIKFWYNGAVCFFIFWGLGMLVGWLDLVVILGVVLGMVNDLLVNNTFHFFAVTPGSNNKWMMFPERKFWTFFANIIYSFVILFFVIQVYNLLGIIVSSIAGDSVVFGVEPIAFGLIYMAIDMLFIGMKALLKKIISDAKENSKVQ
jgi:hypothetical protein